MKTLLFILILLSSVVAENINELKGNAGCIIKQNNKVLLVTQYNGKLSIPGGLADYNETAIQTALRETYEETQLKVKVVDLFRKFENGFYLFECKIVEQKNELKASDGFSHEVIKVDFYDIHKLFPKDLRYPLQYQIYLDFQETNR